MIRRNFWENIWQAQDVLDGNKDLDSNISLDELATAIGEISEDSSAGSDRIQYSFIQHIPLETRILLLTLYNRLWDRGEIITAWKCNCHTYT